MRKKNNGKDEVTLYLPAPGFKRRYMPPVRLSVNPGDWSKQPLFLSSRAVDVVLEKSLFDFDDEEVIL